MGGTSGFYTDLNQEQWTILASLLPPAKSGGRPRTTCLRGVLDAVFYLLRTGCQWRLLHVWQVAVPLQSMARDVILLALAGLSWATTARRVRIENAFTWDPILEVVYLFAGIFLTILPVLAILRTGSAGALSSVVAVELH